MSVTPLPAALLSAEIIYSSAVRHRRYSIQLNYSKCGITFVA